MKKLLAILFLILISGSVFAQSTANQVQTGYLGTTGCPGLNSPCFVPYPTPTALVVSTTLESNHILKSTPGNVYALSVTSTPAGYALLLNTTSAPGDGAVTPIWCETVAANSTKNIFFNVPIAFTTAITAVFSTTGCFNKTASATAFFSAAVQ